MAQLVLFSGMILGTFAVWFLLLRPRGIHLAYVACAAFVVVMPFSSMTGDFMIDQLPLRGRMVALAVMAVAAVWTSWQRMFKGVTAATLLLFAAVFFASFYSDFPFVSFKFKLIAVTSIVGGIGLAHASIQLPELQKNLRFLLIPMTIPMVYLFMDLVITGSKGRLGALGLNPNSIGIICAGCLLISLYVAAWDRSLFWRAVAMILTTGFGICVVATGSRASFGAAAICSFIVLAPLLRKPVRLFMVGAVVAISAWYMLSGVTLQAASRVTDWQFQSGRIAMWTNLIENNRGSFLWGSGTLLESDRRWGGLAWTNAHSMYVQVWCELGLLGTLLLVAVMVYLWKVCFRVFRRSSRPEKWLAFSLCAMPFIIGVAEAVPLKGNFIVTLLWGMGVGLLDQLSRIDEPAPEATFAENYPAQLAYR